MMHALALLVLMAQEGKPDEKQVLELVQKLDADDAETRERAEADLLKMGEAVVPLLEKARGSAGNEGRARIERAVAELTTASRWTKELLGDEVNQAAYARLEQALQSKTLDKKHLARILTLVIQNEGATDQLKYGLISSAVRYKVREIWPVLLQMAVQDDRQTSNALSQLQQLRPPKEALDEMLRVLPRVKGHQVTQFLEMILALKPERAKLDAAVRAIFESDTDENARSALMSYVQQGRIQVSLGTILKSWKNLRSRHYTTEAAMRTPPDESVGELIAWLASPQFDEVALAADYVAKHKVAQAAAPLVEAWKKTVSAASAGEPEVEVSTGPYVSTGSLRHKLNLAMRAISIEDHARRWLGSEPGPPRMTVLGLIAELKLRSLDAKVVECLDDRDPAVRKEAARVSGVLKLAEAAPKLEARLKDEGVPVRVAALQSLAWIRGSEATAVILEQLSTGHPDVQAAAIGMLHRSDIEAALDALTREPLLSRPVARQALASLIVHLGEPGAHRVLLRVEGKVPASELTERVRLLQAARGR